MERDATLENVQAVRDLLQEHGFQVLVKEGDKKPIIMNIMDGSMELKINSFIGSMKYDIRLLKVISDSKVILLFIIKNIP